MKHFHGRVTYNCNPDIPVKNVLVYILREYDTGTQDRDHVADCVTDINGYYSVMADVKLKGVLEGYILMVNYQECENRIESKDVEINCELGIGRYYSFHIKNTTPFNNSDLFNSLTITDADSSHPGNVIISNLYGLNVDTVIFYFSGNSPHYYKYEYTKNASYIETAFDSLITPTCLDTLQTNIFY